MLEKKAAVLGSPSPETAKILAGVEGLTCIETIPGNIPIDADCILIPCGDVTDELGKLITQAKEHFLPVGVITENASNDELEHILDLGADDIIPLPLPVRLVSQRITALCSIASFAEGAVDFSLFDKIADSNGGIGSFIIQENDFANIYRFVLRLLERLDKKAQLLIFNVSSRFQDFIEPEIVHNFSGVVQRCLRRGDISSLHGRQVFVILIGADTAGGNVAAKRLIDTYFAHFDDDAYDIDFQIKEINPKAM